MPDGNGFTPWSGMAPEAPAPSTSGTARDFANMQNEKPAEIKKQRKSTSHWELPAKLKLGM